jgi:hypothetical protein
MINILFIKLNIKANIISFYKKNILYILILFNLKDYYL